MSEHSVLHRSVNSSVEARYLHVRKHGHPRKLCFYIAMSPSRAELHARLARYNIPDPEQPPPPPPPRQPRPPGAWKARFGRMVPRRFRDDVESRGQDHAAVASPAHASGSSTPAPAWKEDGDELPGYHDTRTLPPRYQDTICLGA